MTNKTKKGLAVFSIIGVLAYLFLKGAKVSKVGGLVGAIGALTPKPSQQKVLDYINGYFTRYNRTPKIPIKINDAMYIRDSVLMAASTMKGAKVLSLMEFYAKKYGVNVSEAIEYWNSNPAMRAWWVSKENLEMETIAESLGRVLHNAFVAPLKFIGDTVGDGISGLFWGFFKKLIPVLIIIGSLWVLIMNRKLLISKNAR